MKLTPTIERAIKKASILHGGQTRRSEEDLPYVTHLFSVAALLSAYAPREDVIVAGLLHDTLEDTPYTGDALEKEFGARVREMVETVTEATYEEKKDEVFNWRARKERYLRKLEKANAGALMISAADKIHNIQSLIDGHRKHGDKLWDMVKMKPKQQLWFFGEVLAILEDRLESDIVDHFRREYEEAVSLFTT